MSSKLPRLTEVFKIRESTLTEEPPESPGPSPTQKLRAQHPMGLAKPGEVIKKTSKPNSVSLSTQEWQEWAKNPPQTLRIVSDIDGKPLATLSAPEVKQMVSKAKYMQGMVKGINSDAGWWLAPFQMKRS